MDDITPKETRLNIQKYIKKQFNVKLSLSTGIGLLQQYFILKNKKNTI